MKHLRLFESFKEQDIRDICKKYDIKNYTINEDGSIDVRYVYLYRQRLAKLPLKFRNVSDYFDCSDNQLTSLEGCPKTVGGDFYCNHNQLTSLEGCPKSIGGSFYFGNNQLTSFKGCPEYIGDDFDCLSNNIVTFEHLSLSIVGNFDCYGNPIWEVWKLFNDYSKIEFLNDCDALREPNENSEEPIIILDRLNYFLEEIGKEAANEVKGYKCI